MTETLKPIIFVSKCLGFAKCRWNGDMIPDKFVDKLKPHVEYLMTCPESEIGLGVPRDPIRIVWENNGYQLKQLNTEKDVTVPMKNFVSGYLKSIPEIDGFILKDRSPSCGLRDVKVYPSLKPSSSIKRTSGFFGEEVLTRFPNAAAETEARLSNFAIREHFLTKIFTSARFRRIKQDPEMKTLIRFQAENKLLLMAYSQKEMRLLGNITANREKKKIEDVFREYEQHLFLALEKAPKFSACINVLMHALGYFSDKLTAPEKRFFLNTLEEYRREQAPLSVPLNLITSYIIRFNEEYLKPQTFFSPYPKELLEVSDSGKGRDYA